MYVIICSQNDRDTKSRAAFYRAKFSQKTQATDEEHSLRQQIKKDAFLSTGNILAIAVNKLSKILFDRPEFRYTRTHKNDDFYDKYWHYNFTTS